MKEYRGMVMEKKPQEMGRGSVGMFAVGEVTAAILEGRLRWEGPQMAAPEETTLGSWVGSPTQVLGELGEATEVVAAAMPGYSQAPCRPPAACETAA